jgi:hypothetical protein
VLCTRPWGDLTPMQVLDVKKHRKPKQKAGQTRERRSKVVSITPIEWFKQGFGARGKDRLTTLQTPLTDTSFPQG